MESPKRKYAASNYASSVNDRQGKGLRHYSIKVCEKLEQMGTTTYNEIANALVRDFMSETKQYPMSKQHRDDVFAGDEKNIRRRIYDALNVLCAMDIISKDKKKIRWKGLEHSSGVNTENLTAENQRARQRVAEKQQVLGDCTLEFLSMEHLKHRNEKFMRFLSRQRYYEAVGEYPPVGDEDGDEDGDDLDDESGDEPTVKVEQTDDNNAMSDDVAVVTGVVPKQQRPAGLRHVPDDAFAKLRAIAEERVENKFTLPFLVVNCDPDVVLSVEMSDTQDEAVLHYAGAFEVYDDQHILREICLNDRGTGFLDGGGEKSHSNGAAGPGDSPSKGAGTGALSAQHESGHFGPHQQEKSVDYRERQQLERDWVMGMPAPTLHSLVPEEIISLLQDSSHRLGEYMDPPENGISSQLSFQPIVSTSSLQQQQQPPPLQSTPAPLQSNTFVSSYAAAPPQSVAPLMPPIQPIAQPPPLMPPPHSSSSSSAAMAAASSLNATSASMTTITPKIEPNTLPPQPKSLSSRLYQSSGHPHAPSPLINPLQPPAPYQTSSIATAAMSNGLRLPSMGGGGGGFSLSNSNTSMSTAPLPLPSLPGMTPAAAGTGGSLPPPNLFASAAAGAAAAATSGLLSSRQVPPPPPSGGAAAVAAPLPRIGGSGGSGAVPPPPPPRR